MPEFTDKQRRFISYYIGESHGNATDAARRAGYRHPNMAGPRLMLNASIKSAVEARVMEIALTADEVLSRLSEQAFADIGELVKINKRNAVTFDFARAKRMGKLHLIKKIRRGKYGWEVEFYDAQAALQLLGKYHNLFNDRPPAPEQGKDYPELINVMDAPPRNGTANGNGHL